MEYSEGQYWDQLNDDNRMRLQAGLRDRGLISWQDLNLPKEMEDIKQSDLDKWVVLCEEKGVDPQRVVVDDNNLNYKWVTENYDFKAVYCPNELYKCQGKLVKPCVHKIPETTLNFMAGNYGFSRWRLLQNLWKNNLLTDSTKLFWSAYRSWEQDSTDAPECFTSEFLEFMKQNVPRTFMGDTFYNKYPEDINLGTFEQRYILDFNNQDTWIYENSLISVVVDTFSTWPRLNEDPKDRFPNVYTTPKTFKAIKHKRPFILTIGKQPGELEMFRNLGFETFSGVWDETYDTDSFHKTVDHIGDLCYNLSNENINELYYATADICEHNYNVLMNTDWVAWYLNELDKQYGL